MQIFSAVMSECKTVLSRIWFVMVWVVILLGFVLLVSRYVRASIDDLFIILRYVENAANGYGLAYNIGERVEGYTCFGWVLSLWGLVSLGWPAYWAAKLMGIVCSIGTLWLSYGIGRELWHGKPHAKIIAFLPTFLLLVNPDFLYWSVSGLETPLFTVSVVAVIYLLVIETRLAREQQLTRWMVVIGQAILCSIATLTRPEGIVLLAYAFVAKFVMWRSRHDWLRYCMALGVSVSVPIIAFFIWRFHYYGEWLPNTYYAKMDGAIFERIHSGRFNLQGFLASNCFGWVGMHGQSAWPGIMIFMLLPVIALFVVQKKRAHLVVLGWAIILTAIIVWEGGDWMPHNRFFVPVLACFMLLVVHSVLGLIDRIGECSRVFCRQVVTIASVVLIAALFLDYLRLNIRHAPISSIERDDSWPVVFSRYILESAPTGTLAASDIGLIGYITHYRVIDLAGLVDKHISRSFGNSFQKDYDIMYVLNQLPDFIVLTDQRCLAEDRLRQSPEFMTKYKFIKKHEAHSLYENNGKRL